MLFPPPRTCRCVASILLLGAVLSLPFTPQSLGEPLGAATSVDAAPDSIHLGVVWTPPRHPGPAVRSLRRIHAHGANAVRLTRIPTSDAVFAQADSLDLHLYVDLPISFVSATSLDTTLAEARPQLERILELADRHSSLKYVGLADHVDTTVPSACKTLSEWTTRVHDAQASLQTYYVTPFRAAADACDDAVDRPLIATHGQPHPVRRWRTWNQKRPGTGIGTLGTWMRPKAPSGLRSPHSIERQARYLEKAFSNLLSSPSPTAVFVYRWNDRSPSTLPSRRYGLIDTSGAPRPAADVVRGFFTSEQRVFAFPDGQAPSSMPVPVIVFGWTVVLIVAGLYAASPFFRQTSVRYFRAHAFYLDAVRQGRDVRSLPNVALLFVVTGTVGTITTLGARMIDDHPPSEFLIAALPSRPGSHLAHALSSPYEAGLVAALVTLAALTLWMGLLTVSAGWKRIFSPSQALMLVVWPFWPVLFGGIVALVAAAESPIPRSVVAVLLCVGGVGTIVTATVRVLYDYRKVTKIPILIVLVLALASPLVLLGVAVGALLTQYEIPLQLLWHLMVHT